MGFIISTVCPSTEAASESAAKRGLMLDAISNAVVPLANSLIVPSGKVILIILFL